MTTDTSIPSAESYVVGSGVVPGTKFSLAYMNKPKGAAKRGKFPSLSTQEIDTLIERLQSMRNIAIA